MTLRRRVAEKMGYKVALRDRYYVLVDPQGDTVPESRGFPNSTPDEAWDFVPAFDTWEGVGKVMEWLSLLGVDFWFIWATRKDDFPKALCEFALGGGEQHE